MIKDVGVPLFDLMMSFSHAMDLVSPALVNHQKRVAYMASCLAGALGLSGGERNNILLAGLLHDCGALSLKDKMDALQFEFGFEAQERNRHGQTGYKFLKNNPQLSDVAAIIKYHHVYWSERNDLGRGEIVPLGSHVLHLADRVDVLIDRQKDVLGQARGIMARISEEAGRMFDPELVKVFKRVALQECFWLDVVSPFLDNVLARKYNPVMFDLDLDGLLEVARFFYQVIDCRSVFTATHSLGVAAAAEALAGYMGFSGRECQMMKIAGYLHDLGKIAVPAEILEKPGKLSEDEFNIMKRHTFYTYRILEPIPGLDTINRWGAFHHERLDGSGYPFRIGGDNLTLGSRIVAVADTFTALMEDRPYRKAMGEEKALSILNRMAADGKLDRMVVKLLTDHFAEINALRLDIQKKGSEDFAELELGLFLMEQREVGGGEFGW